jgi:hypothetical protein
MYLELDVYFLRREALRKPLEKLCKMMIEVQSAVAEFRRRHIGLGEITKLIKEARWQLWFCFKVLCSIETLVTMFASGSLYNLILLIADMLYILLGEIREVTIPSAFDSDEFAQSLDTVYNKRNI